MQTQGQVIPFRFEHFTIKDGLSQSLVYSIFQDRYGYVWIGTQDGLNRFDGSEFKVFKNDPFDSTTLTHNWVWSVQEDEQGNIWAGTFQGLCKYIRNEDRFVQYYHNPKDTSSIGGNRTNYIVKDLKGRLWISSWGTGLNLYNATTDTFTNFKNDPEDESSLSDNFIRTLFCDSEGILWIGTWNGGLNRVIEDANGIRFERYPVRGESGEGSGRRITTIAEDKQQNLWIGNHENGLIIMSRKEGFKHVPNFLANDVNKIISDRYGNMWIGTNHGLRFYDREQGTFHTYQYDPALATGISGNSIYSLMEDRKGIVWVSGHGFDLYDPGKNYFKTYQKHNNAGDLTQNNDQSQNNVWAFCEDDENNIWIGMEDGPVLVFNPKTNAFRSITISDGMGTLAVNNYRIRFLDGVFWIGSFNSGLIRYEKKSGKARFFVGAHRSVLARINMINELLIDYQDSTLWIGTMDNGLLHYDPENEQVIQYHTDRNDPETISSNQISSISQDRKGNIWVGLLGAGMSTLDKATGKFKNYRYDRKNANGLSDQIVVSITQQDDSVYWVCTHSGINKLNVNTGKFTHFLEKEGLANNVTYEMLKEDAGDYWISSNKGLSRFNAKTTTFKNFTEEDGLQSNEFNSNAAFKSSTGEFYFGGVNGFNVFRPEDIRTDTTPPTVIMQGYTVFHKAYPPQQKITLDYFQNYITFSYAAIEFSAPDKVRYAYQLEGVDENWIEAGNKREAQYTNLDPGTYTFHVKAANADGFWSSPGVLMTVFIQPPFWQTWWFIGLVVFASGGIIYAIHHYRLEQSLKVERLRNKIASDLHDEVGSSLTRISIYSDLVQNQTKEIDNKPYLAGIHELSREVVSTMSDIVWSIDNRHDTFGSLTLRMMDFANEILNTKNVGLEFSTRSIQESVVLDPVLKQNIYLIFKEAIHNIVKHAGAEHVRVTLANEGDVFSMTIQDNGQGIGEAIQAKGNGLRNMNRRASVIRGVLEILNHQGTTVVLKRKAIR